MATEWFIGCSQDSLTTPPNVVTCLVKCADGAARAFCIFYASPSAFGTLVPGFAEAQGARAAVAIG